MASRAYLLSLPERVIRSALGLSAGLLREVGVVVLPQGVRRSALYRSLVDTTLRYVIEHVGGAEGVYPTEQPQPGDFLIRRGGAQGGGPPARRVSVRERRSAVGRARKDLLASRSSFVRSATERRRIAEGVADDSRPGARGQPARASVSDCDRQTVGAAQARVDASGAFDLRDLFGDGNRCRTCPAQ